MTHLAADGDAALGDAELLALAGDHRLDLDGPAQQLLERLGRLRGEDRGRARLDDPGLLGGDLLDRGAEEVHVVQVDRRHDRDLAVDRVGRVPFAAEAHLDDGDVDRRVGEQCVRETDHHLEERQLDLVLGVDEFDVGRDLLVRPRRSAAA